MINFNEYKKTHVLVPLEKTNQSQTFLTEVNGEKRVCKKYGNMSDRCKEELAYTYLKEKSLLNTPTLIDIGIDFIEMQFILEDEKAELSEIISGIKKLYTNTLNYPDLNKYFPFLDTSKSKIVQRLEYLPTEMDKRKGRMDDLFKKCNNFLKNQYISPSQSCLVHGDLKSPHIIKSTDGIYYIDLSLASIANPWYDLAFLYMEKRDKDGLLLEMIKISQDIFGKEMNVSNKEAISYMKSSIFYRSLYDVIFALRHRPDKTLARTIKDLDEIASD
ncbi:MAG: phosphotransferase [Nanoarchaeota archaeon]